MDIVRQEKLSIELEIDLHKETKKYFNKYIRALKDSKELPKIEGVLKNHFDKTFEVFKDAYKITNNPKEYEDNLLRAYKTLTESDYLKFRAALINNTNINEVSLNNLERGSIKDLADKLLARSTSIAITETGAYRELSKKISINVASGRQGLDSINDGVGNSLYSYNTHRKDKPKQIVKRWLTSRDSKVRTSHKKLEGVTLKEKELFHTINGSLLLYPYDTSNGAKIEDIINCRCMASYSML